jgi:hypothetical protein
MFVLQSLRSNLSLGQLVVVGGSPYVTRSTKSNTLCHNDLDLVKSHLFKKGLICFNHTNTSSQNHVELIEIEYF